MTLTFDLWPWKPLQQCPLTWWIFVASFMKIPPLSTEISRHA